MQEESASREPPEPRCRDEFLTACAARGVEREEEGRTGMKQNVACMGSGI